jgi:hypothetical protein
MFFRLLLTTQSKFTQYLESKSKDAGVLVGNRSGDELVELTEVCVQRVNSFNSFQRMVWTLIFE